MGVSELSRLAVSEAVMREHEPAHLYFQCQVPFHCTQVPHALCLDLLVGTRLPPGGTFEHRRLCGYFHGCCSSMCCAVCQHVFLET